jgi:hypothetical protein
MFGQKKDTSGTTGDETKISVDVAEQEFENYCNANDIDTNVSGMDDDDKKAFEKIKRRFVKACRAGRVVADGTSLTYTLSKFSNENAGAVIKVDRPLVKGFIAGKQEDSVLRVNSLLSSMTGKEISFFAKIDVSDWMFLSDLATLFLSE